MDHKLDWELIHRYLDNNATQNDKKALDDYLDASDENKVAFQRIQKIWDTADTPLPRPDMEKAWENICILAEIKEPAPAKTIQFKPPKKALPVMQRILGSRLLRVAAVFLLMILTPYLVFKYAKSTSMNEIYVDNTKQKIVVLPEGTRITLDAGSFLSYSEHFSDNSREVYLKGEGFFEVTSDPDRPFIVHANNAVITVLGTKFNVRSWEQYNQTTVAVAEGKVSLKPDKSGDCESEVIITKNQYSILRKNKIPAPPQNTNINFHLLWQQQEMYFQNATLQEVLDQLERWHNLEFKLPDKSFASNRVTIFIENKPVENIIETIALTNNFNFQLEGNKIIFSLKKIKRIIK